MIERDLYSVEQARPVLEAMWSKIRESLAAGKKMRITIKDIARSHPQNAMFHAIIGQIAKQAQHQGAKWDAESWKRFLVDQWAHDQHEEGYRLAPSLDNNRIIQLGRQTKEFTKEEAASFTEWLIAWAAMRGIELEDRT